MVFEMNKKQEVMSKKIGVLLRESRLSNHWSLEDCARCLNTTPQEIEAIEYGESPPSLPQLELLAYYYNRPLEYFLKQQKDDKDIENKNPENTATFLLLRQRYIGAVLRKARIEAKLSIEKVAEQCAISPQTLESFEMGDVPIPYPWLDTLIKVLNLDTAELLDQKGMVARKRTQDELLQSLSTLPQDCIMFIANKENLPYIRAAQQLKLLSKESIAVLLQSFHKIFEGEGETLS